MRWYVASIIISYRLKDIEQKVFPIYENFTLFYANSRKEAWEKAKLYGEEYSTIDDKLEINGKDAYTKYEGIRKLVEIIDNEFSLKKPIDGLEISYSYMEVYNKEDIKKLADGKAVKVNYIDNDE